MAMAEVARSGAPRHLLAMRAWCLALLLLLPVPVGATNDLCRLYPRDGVHAGCGACGGPGWRRADGQCARWNDVGAPDCRALRGELRDPARCNGPMRERPRR
jgi:hypothetical protein